ncbi:MAG: dTMP kinase [Acetobacteraceae bacterium]|nr:dTMP kinase [Acetobacteraceae bacterium]MSP30442.1 dTMP kinase [Acetobacteraceae bacterium]
MAGHFLTFEGGEGAGKSTQARLLAAALCARGLPVLRTREPGGTPGAERLRALLLGGETDWSAPAEALLHFAARAEHIERSIRPALDAGFWVICDRFSDSTLAYQGYGQGADRGLIRQLGGLMNLVPHMTFILNISDDIAKYRLFHRGEDADRYERLDAFFHSRVNVGFRDIAAAAPERCVLVAADGSEHAVHQSIMTALQHRLDVPA